MDTQLTTKGLLRFLDHVPVLQGLAFSERENLLSQAQLHSFERRSVIQASGAVHHHLYVVVTGQIDMCAVAENGDDRVAAVFGPRGVTSWMALFHETPAERELVANPDTRVVAFPASAIRSMLERNPHIYPLVLKMEAQRFRLALNGQQIGQTKDRTRRIAALLQMFVEVSGDNREQPVVSLTSEKLAKAAQCSRQMLYLSIKALSRRGLVRQDYGKVTILDVDGLEQLRIARLE